MAQGGTMPSRTGRRRPVAPSASSGVGAAGNQEGAEEILEEKGMQQVWESVRCQRCQQQPVSNTRRKGAISTLVQRMRVVSGCGGD
jgi:hypothetical protein